MEKEKKENQRVMLTKKLLKNSLIELLKTKSIYKISIRELCELSGINRSTFYKYYGSQFDLLAEMESDILSLVEQTLACGISEETQSLHIVFQYIEDNLELVRLLINNNIDPQFPEKLFGLPQVQNAMLQSLGSKYTAAQYEYISAFLTYGAYQIIRVWINKEKREMPEEIVNILLKLTTSVV